MILPIIMAYNSHQQNTDLYYSFTSNNATQCNITIGNTPNGTVTINQKANKTGQTFTSFISGSNFSINGDYCFNLECTDGGQIETGSFCKTITPTGKQIDNEGQVSVGIIYFFVIIGFGFIFVGYLFLNNNSLWISYSGLFMMLIGFGFIYYDLHLTNLYATTIAINSGASNVTGGAFLMIVRIIKLAPYLVAGIIAFASVKLFRASISRKKSKDGWDNNEY